MHNTQASWLVQYAGPWSYTIHTLAQAADRMVQKHLAFLLLHVLTYAPAFWLDLLQI